MKSMTDYREHIVKSFDDEIANVIHLVTQMATLVEEQYKLLYHVVDTGSPATTEDILENEPKLDNYDAEIRDAVITLITLRSPVAVDLRDILTSLRISTDLERLGDYAKNIAMRVATLEEIPDTSVKNDILRLLNLVQVQLKKVIDAYVSKDLTKAKEVIKNDVEIDKTYNAIYEKIVDLIKGKVSKLRLLTYTKLLFAIKTLERAGDHIENVAEEIHFIVTGEHVDLKDEKKDSKLEHAIEESNK
jgi:phosphate transport system protein